jgi:hypothetical protein
MTTEQIKSLTKYLDKQSVLFNKYDYITISLSKAEVECIVNHLHEHAEPTHEEVMDYCKARHLNLITNSLLSELISRK